MPDDLKVLAFNCTLKSARGDEKSSTQVLIEQLMDALKKHGAKGDVIRAVDHNIKPGVQSDEGAGDDWPALRQRVINADILMMGTPIWLGQPSSVAKRVMERMDARSEEHTSELQSRSDLVCRLLLEKKKKTIGLMTVI